MEKIKCPRCGTAIMIQEGQETLVKTRLLKIAHGKKEAKCPNCKEFVEILF